MSAEEKATLAGYRGFIEILGVSEMTDEQFDDYMRLCAKEKENKMTLDIKKYDRKPFSVDAVQVTEENFEEVAKWAHGRVIVEDVKAGETKKYIKVNVKHPLSQRQTKAYVGDWVLSSKRGYKVYTDAAINHAFVQRDEDAPQELFTTNEPAEEKSDAEGHNIFESKQSDYALIGTQQDVHDAIRGKR